MERDAQRELQALLTRLAEGDRSVFRAVFDLARPVIERFARRALPDRADADDVAQEALLKVFARASEFDPSRRALPWILAIAAFEIRTARKKQARRKESDAPLETFVACDPDPEQLIIDRDLLAGLQEIFGAMRPDDAEAILASAEVIDRPAIAPATFRKRLQRAMSRLREAWGAKS